MKNEDLLAKIKAAEAIEDTVAMLDRLRDVLVGRCFMYTSTGSYSSGVLLYRIESIGLYEEFPNGRGASDIEVKMSQLDLSMWRGHRTLNMQTYDDNLDYLKSSICDAVEVTSASFDNAVSLAAEYMAAMADTLQAVELY